MTPFQGLVKVKELLNSEDKWVKSVFAKTNEAYSVQANHPNAVAWCLRGAIQHVMGLKTTGSYQEREVAELMFIGTPKSYRSSDKFNSIATFNNAYSTTFSKLHKMLDKAIAIAAEDEFKNKVLVVVTKPARVRKL